MQRTKKRVLTILAFSLILLLSSIIISAYTSSNAQYTRPNSFDYLRSLDAFPRFDESQCEAGQDFILQIVPASCTPTVVRSDLLEEQNVPVFCPIMATKINPLIDVNAIDRISFKKEFPKDVSAVGFHPARAALSQGRELINSPIDTNIGYAVIVLKQNPIESSMPESVSGTLKATLTYDIKNAFGLGKANFISGELDDNEWKQQANKYSFWQGRGFVRVESVGDKDASISIYSGPEEVDKITEFRLNEGETSRDITMPGFYCLASLQVKLEDLDIPNTKAVLSINGDITEVTEKEKFLDNRCQVKNIGSRGLQKQAEVVCETDNEGRETLELETSPVVSLRIISLIGNDIIKGDFTIGDILYQVPNNEKRIFLGYIGENEKGAFIVPVVSPAQTKEQFKETLEYNALEIQIRAWDFKTESSLVNSIYDITAGRGIGGTITGAITTGGYPSDPIYIKQEGNVIPFSERLTIIPAAAQQVLNDIYKKKTTNDEYITSSITFIDFAGAVNKDLGGEASSASTYFQEAISNYNTVLEDFPNEKIRIEGQEKNDTYSETSIYEAVLLARDAGQFETLKLLGEKFIQEFPNSPLKKKVEDMLKPYKLTNSANSVRSVLINNKLRTISLEDVVEPTRKEYSAEILIQGAGTNNGPRSLGKEEQIPLSEKDSYIKLIELNENYAVFEYDVSKEGIIGTIKDAVYKENDLRIKKDETKILGGKVRITLTKVNLEKVAKISLKSDTKNVKTEANFSFHIGIEKRAIQLSPEKAKQKISNIEKQIKKWTTISENLAKVVKGFKASCLTVGGYLTVKNFFQNLDGKAIARQDVMKKTWNTRCAGEVGPDKEFQSLEQCFFNYSDEIDQDVENRYQAIQDVNSQLKILDDRHSEIKYGTKVVDTQAVKNEYMPVVAKDVYEYDQTLPLEQRRFKSLEDTQNHLKAVSITSLREIHTDIKTSKISGSSTQLNTDINNRINTNLNNIKTLYDNDAKRNAFLRNVNEALPGVKDLSVVTHNDGRTKYPYSGGQITNIAGTGTGFKGLIAGKQIQGVEYNSRVYLVSLDYDLTKKVYTVKDIYDDQGSLIATRYYSTNEMYLEGGIDKDSNEQKAINTISKMTFSSATAETCKNNVYKNPEIRYYETAPNEGYPAIVPFDLNNGWYAAIKQTLGSTSYENSGAVRSFYVCNVGSNGREEFFSGVGDDICQGFNTITGQTYGQFSCLSDTESRQKVQKAIRAIEDAQRQHKSGISNVDISGVEGGVSVGSPMADIPEMQCTDFMSPKDCLLMFNACDPVICPSSRCDLGGTYPVDNVVQSGIVGSLALCLPNAKEGIVVPICLTGVQAGVDGYLSIMQAYKGCLEENIATGKTIGICDEIHSIYMCEFFWRQAVPLSNLIIPKLIEYVTGQSLRGGGEYMGVASAWQNTQSSLNFFTQYYGANSYAAFKARSTDEVGGEVCKAFVSARYPNSQEFLDALLEPDSPPQYHAWFEQIPFSTATTPATSHYKVFYHIFSGKDQGTYYRVYLRNPSGTSVFNINPTYQVANGYIPKGDSADATEDFVGPTGYQELCLQINAKTECGFKQVTTSFALDYISDSYKVSEAEKTNIITESECISGSPNALALATTPNVQEGVGNVVNPELYNYGIIRVCATNSPGMQTDTDYNNPEKARWREVGYCDSPAIKCWLDTESVKNSIQINPLEDRVLETVADENIKRLIASGEVLDENTYRKISKQILDLVGRNPVPLTTSSNSQLTQAAALIDLSFPKAIFSWQKAELTWLRARIYNSILRKDPQVSLDGKSNPQTAPTPTTNNENSKYVEPAYEDDTVNPTSMILSFVNGPGKIVTLDFLTGYDDCTIGTHPDVASCVGKEYKQGEKCALTFMKKPGTRCILEVSYYNQGKVVSDYFESYENLGKLDIKSASEEFGDEALGGGGTKEDTNNLIGKIIVLDPGHGGDDPGNVYETGTTQIKEKDIVWKITQLAKTKLEEKGATVFLTKTENENPSKRERRQTANDRDAEIYISIHANSAKTCPSDNSAGTEAFVFCFASSQADGDGAVNYIENPLQESTTKKYCQDTANGGLEGLKKDHALATKIYDKVKPIFNNGNRGIKGADLTVLNGAEMPSAYIEMGFLCNQKDRGKLTSATEQEKISQAIVDGIEEYITQ